ncbi:proline-rich receptor-like protein kinase PERK12 [Triticum aestivum]|uniref:non-specific serine/threonine protein kinase n=2 Tax=Triticum TaxID=4564 RepID=A0A9R0ZXF0_TRITD|nr:proline-rich receptor-like protein kinase PERK12 [Triticum aestivum]VAI85682.1 unnamed protein product [Triticum turgidum subsp. durum]
MPRLAPSPGSSSEDSSDDRSDGSKSKSKSKAPPPRRSSRSSGSSSDENGDDSSSPSPPSSDDDDGGSRSSSSSSDSQDSSPSDSKGSQSSRRSPPPTKSKSSPSPSSSPSRPSSSRNGGKSDSSPPPPTDESSGDGEDTDSSPPPTRSSPPKQSEDSEPSPSSSSSRSPPPRSSPPPPPRRNGNDDQAGSSPPDGSQPPPSPSPSPPPPPAPANHSVVFIVNSHPGAPPGLVSIAPPGTVGVMSAQLPGAQGGAAGAGGMQAAGSSASTSSTNGAGGSAASASAQQLHSSQVNGQVVAAIAGASVAGLLFIIVAIFFIVTRRRRKMMGGMVYHSDGSRSYYMHSSQLTGSNHPSGMFYGPPPPGASGGFSYGSSTPGPTDSFRGAGYPSGSMESKSSFSYEELTSITSNFSRDNVIGEGGFGCVYKGWLADGKCVAVKQLKAGSGQGEREFQAEVEIISRVHHRHLVSLVGYCVAQQHRMLIYEFVPNGTLEDHLHGRGVPTMDWPTRLRIAIGAAKGLAYLHEDCHPRIIHRDIKSANILLDYSFEAQVADFGLAKLSNDTHTHVSTRIMGTFGYLAPEYASSGKLTDRSDVFSFGVVLLELITGRKPVDQDRPLGEESLAEWARPILADAIETGNHDELADPRLEGRYNKAEMVRMVEAAAACIRHSAPKRPRMVQVMRALDVDVDEGSMSDLSNGVKVGQSQVFNNSQQEAALEQLRRTAFASEEFTGEFEPSGEYGAAVNTMNQPRPAG